MGGHLPTALTLGFVTAGPVSGHLSDRYGAKLLATGGLAIMAASLVGLVFIPVDFSYPAFAVLLLLNGGGSGLFSAPNTTAVMNAVPERQRGVASGIRATFQNAGMVISVGLFFSLLTAGLSRTLPGELRSALAAHGVPDQAVDAVAAIPPVHLMFAAFLGSNPLASLLGSVDVLLRLPPTTVATLTSPTFLPALLSGPFHDGLVVVFILAAVLAAVGAVVSLFRGGIYIGDESDVDAGSS